MPLSLQDARANPQSTTRPLRCRAASLVSHSRLLVLQKPAKLKTNLAAVDFCRERTKLDHPPAAAGLASGQTLESSRFPTRCPPRAPTPSPQLPCRESFASRAASPAANLPWPSLARLPADAPAPLVESVAARVTIAAVKEAAAVLLREVTLDRFQQAHLARRTWRTLEQHRLLRCQGTVRKKKVAANLRGLHCSLVLKEACCFCSRDTALANQHCTSTPDHLVKPPLQVVIRL